MTKKSDTVPFLPSERKKTDESLVSERKKSNESLQKSQLSTERKIDNIVLAERQQADQRTQALRSESDARRDSESDSSSQERQSDDTRLHQERKRADLAIDQERKRVDSAIDSERELNILNATKLLERERQITDKNLKNERSKTDSQRDEASGLLESEVSEHSRTKSTLTSREEFLAIVSHDLRNPIGAASSCAEMLLEDPEFETMGADLKHWIQFIKRNVDTSLKLIADLLDLERISQGKFLLIQRQINIDDLVREAVESFEQVASKKSISLKLDLPAIKCEAFCDPDRIRQVLSNLIGNAIKFTPQDGTIVTSLKCSDKEVCISISDTGPGIAPDKLNKIFERFAQIDSADRSGLGLGLYISKTIIQEHGGSLEVQSKLGEGSTFKFFLPQNKLTSS